MRRSTKTLSNLSFQSRALREMCSGPQLPMEPQKLPTRGFGRVSSWLLTLMAG